MIRNILFAILLTHSALVANGKSSRILLQTSTPATTSAGTASAGTTATLAGLAAGATSAGTPSGTPAGTTSAGIASGTTSAGTTSAGSAAGTTAARTTAAGTTAAGTSGPVVVTPVSVTPGPVTPAPVTPVTPAPNTPAPVTPVPVTAAPVTAAPITPSPTTANPTLRPTLRPTFNPTPSPTRNPTMAPLPAGYEYGAWAQVCPIPAVGQPQECTFGGIKTSTPQGMAYCDRYGDCCLCSQIACGTPVGPQPHGCEVFKAGDFGAYGVGAITIIGNPSSGNRGAIIDCNGNQACAQSNLFGDSITYLLCNIDGSCQGATMQIDNPAEYFWIDCNGPESCKDLTIVLNIGTPIPEGSMCNPQWNNIRRFGGIKCNSDSACNGMNLMINNRGCDKIILENLQCLQRDSCRNANFEFNGDIDIENCECGPSCGFATGLGKCFKNLERLLCPDIRSCMNMVKEIVNPMNLFYLECSNELSCAMAYFTIDLEQDQNTLMTREPVRVIDSLKFGGVNSGRGAIVEIHNHQYIDPQSPGRPVQVRVRRLECSSQGSCQGLTIITGDNVIIEERICNTFDSCQGCFIKRLPTDIGEPCNPEPQIQQFIPGQILPGGPGQFVPNQQIPIQQPQQFVPQQPQGQPQFLPFNPQQQPQQQQPNVLPGQPRV